MVFVTQPLLSPFSELQAEEIFFSGLSKEGSIYYKIRSELLADWSLSLRDIVAFKIRDALTSMRVKPATSPLKMISNFMTNK